MSVSKWLVRSGYTPLQYKIARDLLMSGPRATPPTFRAIRKTLARLRRGDKDIGHTGRGWRAVGSI